MVTRVSGLRAWSDDRGNRVEFDGPVDEHEDDRVVVEFRGEGNRLHVAAGARLGRLSVHFNCSNGSVEIGPSSGVPAFSANVRVGQDSRIVVGRNVSCTSKVGLSAVEGAAITIGDDVMFASENQLRCDDGHPIFDIRTRARVNPSRDIVIGNHVWLGWGAIVLGGTTVGRGSVVGLRSVVKGRFPNNVILAGTPARVLRRDIAWERPHLSLVEPYYKPTADSIPTSRYWEPTEDAADPVVRARRSVRRIARGLPGRALLRKVRRRLTGARG